MAPSAHRNAHQQLLQQRQRITHEPSYLRLESVTEPVAAAAADPRTLHGENSVAESLDLSSAALLELLEPALQGDAAIDFVAPALELQQWADDAAVLLDDLLLPFEAQDCGSEPSAHDHNLRQQQQHVSPPSNGVRSSAVAEAPRMLRQRAKPAKKPKFASTRARQQHEKHLLLHQAHELEVVLALLQRPPTAASSVSLSSVAQVKADGSALGGWKRAAETQRARLVRAQSENAQLRRSLLDQKELAKTLQRMLTTRAVEQALQSSRVLRPRQNAELLRDDQFLFQMMATDLARMLAHVDASVAAVERAAPRGNGSSRNWRVCSDAASGAFVEVVACEEVPFRLSAVNDVLRRMRHHSCPGYQSYDPRDFGGPPDLIATTDVQRLVTPIATGAYRQRQASRTIHDDARSVTVSIAYVESVDDAGLPLPGFHFKAQLWSVRTQRMQLNEATGNEEYATFLQFFMRTVPVVVPGVFAPKWDASALETSLIPIWEQQIAKGVQQIENYLLDLHMRA